MYGKIVCRYLVFAVVLLLKYVLCNLFTIISHVYNGFRIEKKWKKNEKDNV